MWQMLYTLNFGFEKKTFFDQYPVVNPAEFERKSRIFFFSNLKKSHVYGMYRPKIIIFELET